MLTPPVPVPIWQCFNLPMKSHGKPFLRESACCTGSPNCQSVDGLGKPFCGEPWMLVVHKALRFGQRLQESRQLCPNQVRAAENLVQDIPFSFMRPHHTRSPSQASSRYRSKRIASFLVFRPASRRLMRSIRTSQAHSSQSN